MIDGAARALGGNFRRTVAYAIVLGTVAVAAVAVLVSGIDKRYRATAVIAVNESLPEGEIATLLADLPGGQTKPATGIPFLPLRARGLENVRVVAARRLGIDPKQLDDTFALEDSSDDPPSFDTTLDEIRRIRITATSTRPEGAAALANGFAEAYIDHRARNVTVQLRRIESSLELRRRLGAPVSPGAVARAKLALANESVRLSVLSAARASSELAAPHPIRDLVVAACLGVSLAVLIGGRRRRAIFAASG